MSVPGDLNPVPEFPELTDLGLEHKALLDRLLHELKPETSELTFTNLFIWRHPFGLRLTRLGEAVAIFSLRPDPEDSFLLTVLGPAGAGEVRACLDLLAQMGHSARVRRIGAADLARLGITEAGFALESDRDNWDYVYRVADLIELAPERYPDKRRHFDTFARKFKYEYAPITPELVPACSELQDLWCDDKHCDLYSSLRAEARAVKETLAHLEELQVTGGAVLVNQRVQAFSLAEPLNDDTVVIHIEKASPDLHGAFQVINREFLAHAWAGWEYVNREQDVGDPGLRRAKESYQPARMVEKFLAYPR